LGTEKICLMMRRYLFTGRFDKRNYFSKIPMKLKHKVFIVTFNYSNEMDVLGMKMDLFKEQGKRHYLTENIFYSGSSD
jgi:hypothetical protein